MINKKVNTSFEELVERTKLLVEESAKESQRFDKRDRMIDLTEEVGELAQAILIVEKRKITSDPKK